MAESPILYAKHRCASPGQNSGYESIEQMRLEPLPLECAGILDGPGNRNNSDLAEFGKLLVAGSLVM